ncbi:pantetheine-phosphate adenylyltransferase, partial [Sphingomonas pseudosanguinis]|nr:pantetheine-phosphate adenylyltransferase [Sphingomonas pseudosanguinis]
MNQQINPRVETVFLMADVALQPIASLVVMVFAVYGGFFSNFVTPAVCEDVVARVVMIGRKVS